MSVKVQRTDDELQRFADEIVLYRGIHDLTQKEFADLCGISRDIVIRAEKGRSISRLCECKIQLVLEDVFF